MQQIVKVTRDFAVAGQLEPGDLEGVARQGFRALVNNRPDGEAPDQPSSLEMEAEARRVGLDYVHIPVVPGEMGEGQARELLSFLDEADGPVLAYCRSGNRSANLWQLAQQLD